MKHAVNLKLLSRDEWWRATHPFWPGAWVVLIVFAMLVLLYSHFFS